MILALWRHARAGGHPSPAGSFGAKVLKYLRFRTGQEMDARLRGHDLAEGMSLFMGPLA